MFWKFWVSVEHLWGLQNGDGQKKNLSPKHNIVNEYYLTIRPLALVFYEQIVNEAQPSWLSLVENEGE